MAAIAPLIGAITSIGGAVASAAPTIGTILGGASAVNSIIQGNNARAQQQRSIEAQEAQSNAIIQEFDRRESEANELEERINKQEEQRQEEQQRRTEQNNSRDQREFRRRRQRRASAGASGRRDTILTSPLGVAEPLSNSTARKTALGT